MNDNQQKNTPTAAQNQDSKQNPVKYFGIAITLLIAPFFLGGIANETTILGANQDDEDLRLGLIAFALWGMSLFFFIKGILSAKSHKH